MTAFDSASSVIDAVRADSELLESDLAQFLAELFTATRQVAGAAGGPTAVWEALRLAFHTPLADALGSKVGQEALRPAGGQALRPSITYWVYRNYRGFTDTAESAADLIAIRRVAVAVRILLKASVVLDDIQDGSAIRYGEPALHAIHGIPLALNTGFCMVLAALRHAAHPGAVQYLEQALEGGFIGQALDISTRLPQMRSEVIAGSSTDRTRFWETVATMKTATLFWMPLNTAAIALDVPEDERAELHDAMRTIGLASQLFNDLTDFVPEFSPGNTYEDFDGITNRVYLTLLDTAPELLDVAPELTGTRLREFVLGHEQLGATIVQLAEQSVELKQSAKERVHRLCRTSDSAAYYDLTIDRKGHVIERLRDAVRARYA
ncbi:polyprenyl synthetase family protein [Nocardia sp. NPDC052112]|uniref:polyprenyl synthetase family protein n=1 Tax=Nocardia sp. NPDC052112 TaxID=3155646 RepID=UPI00342F1BD9